MTIPTASIEIDGRKFGKLQKHKKKSIIGKRKKELEKFPLRYRNKTDRIDELTKLQNKILRNKNWAKEFWREESGIRSRYDLERFEEFLKFIQEKIAGAKK